LVTTTFTVPAACGGVTTSRVAASTKVTAAAEASPNATDAPGRKP